MLIWLASYPRSGNTLLRLVLQNEFGYHTCSLYKERVAGDHPEIGDLVDLTSADVVARAVNADVDLHFVKTHELAPDDTVPAIYVVRDGRDALVSFAHFLIDFVIGEDQTNLEFQYWQTLHELIASNDRHGGWSQNVQSWLARPATIVVKFEDLVRDPIETVRRALCGLDLEPQALHADSLASFEQLHRQSPRFFRTGASGNWPSEMDEVLHELFWQKHGDTMRALGYARNGDLRAERPDEAV